MATTATTPSNLAEQLLRPAAAVEADVVDLEATMTEAELLKTTPATRDATINDGTNMDNMNIEQSRNLEEQHEEEENCTMKRGSTSEQDAAAAAGAGCLENLSLARDEEIPELEQPRPGTSSQGTLEPDGSAVHTTAGCSGSYTEISTMPTSMKRGSLGDERISSRQRSQNRPGIQGESGTMSNADLLRVPGYDQTTAGVKDTSAVTATMAADREAEALSTKRQTQRGQQEQLGADSLTSLEAALQQRQSALYQENRELQQLLDLATQCGDGEALAPKIQLLKEQLLAREQQLHAEKRELTATVKALLSGSECQDEKTATNFDAKGLIPQNKRCSLHTEEGRVSAGGPGTKLVEDAYMDDGGKQPKSYETHSCVLEEKQGARQQQEGKQVETFQTQSRTFMENDKTDKSAVDTGSGQPSFPRKEMNVLPDPEPKRSSLGGLTIQACSKTDAGVKESVSQTLKTAAKDAATSTVACCEQKSRCTTEGEQSRHHSRQRRQRTEEEKDIARRLKKNSTWWRQQVVNRLRLPGPNLGRKRFLSTFTHPETGVDATLLNAVFDQMKILTSTDDGVPTESVTVPHILDLIEKTNGPNILNTLDAAELLEANVRCIERKMMSQKTDLHVFATRLMCRFFLAVSKKSFGELETLCKRVAPREASRTYAEEVENLRQLLIKSVAAENNISIDQSTVVVSKCIHNMRTELQNDLVMLQRAPPSDAQRAPAEPRTVHIERCHTQGATLEKPLPGRGIRTFMTEISSSSAATVPKKLSTTSSSLGVSAQVPVLPPAYSYGALHRLASPGVSPFAVAEFQTAQNTYLAASPPSSHAGTTIAASCLPAATEIRRAAPGTSPSTATLAAIKAFNSSTAASSSPPGSKVAQVSRSPISLSTANTELQLKERRSTPTGVTTGKIQAGKATESEEVLGEEGPVRGHEKTQKLAKKNETSENSTEKSGAVTTKLPANAAAGVAKVVSSSASPPAVPLTQQQASQREKTFAKVVQTVEYRYADGTLVTNPAHLPEGAKVVEAAARARLEETARVAQEAARRAEAAALAQFTAAAAAGGGNATAACVAAAQYQRAFATLNSNSQEPGVLKTMTAQEEAGSTDVSKIQRVSSTMGASTDTLLQEEQQQQSGPLRQQQISQQGQQAAWRPQHHSLVSSTSVGGVLRPLPAAAVAAAAARGTAASRATHVSGGRRDSATAEGIASQKEREINNGARLQRVSSFRGRTSGEYTFPPTNRAAMVNESATTADYNPAAGIVPPGFPPNAAGQLQALLQQQRLLTAVPGVVTSGASPVPATVDGAQITAAGSAAVGGTPYAPRGRISRPLTPKAPEKEGFRRRSRGGCMGSPPHRRSNKSSSSSSRTPSVSSLQRAAGRFFASLGLWKSDGEDEEDEAPAFPDTTLPTPDGLAAAAEKYMNGQQQKLQQQQQQEYGLLSQQLSLQQQQKQRLQQHQLQQHQLQQHQLQQQQLQQHQLQQQQLQQHQLRQQQLQQQQLQQHQLQQQQLHPDMVIPSALPAGGPPSRIPTTCEAPPAELLPKTAPVEAAAARGVTYNMSAAMQQQSLRPYDANEHAGAGAPTIEGAAEKNVFPVYQALYAQQQYRLAQQQRQQQERQRQQPQQEQQQRRPSGEAWLSSQSFILKDLPPRVPTDQTVCSQHPTPDRRMIAPLTFAGAAEKKFASTVESVLEKSGDNDKKAPAPPEKPASCLASSQQNEFARIRMEMQGNQQQTSRQQSYTSGTDLIEKKAIQQQLQQVYMQQQRGGTAGGYNPPTTRDTSVVTTHIPQQTDSPNAIRAASGAAYPSREPALQQTEKSQPTLSSCTARDSTAGPHVPHHTASSYAAAPAAYSAPSSGTSTLQAQQQGDSSSMSTAFPSATAAFGIPPVSSSSRMQQEFELSNTGGISSTTAAYPTSTAPVSGAFPPSVVRTRVKSLSEVPSPQLGAQHIGNFAQIQTQLDGLTQRQIEAYAQQYGLYPTPQAAAAALGGVPLVGVGALGTSSASCNNYAQIMSLHRPLPPVPQNYVFTKS